MLYADLSVIAEEEGDVSSSKRSEDGGQSDLSEYKGEAVEAIPSSQLCSKEG